VVLSVEVVDLGVEFGFGDLTPERRLAPELDVRGADPGGDLVVAHYPPLMIDQSIDQSIYQDVNGILFGIFCGGCGDMRVR
jgi:hypothetical protein